MPGLERVSHFKRDATVISTAIFMTFLAYSGAIEKQSGCITRVDWEGSDNNRASICENSDHRIIVTTRYDEMMMPEYICKPTQVYYNETRNKAYFWRDIDELTFGINWVDMQTGKLGDEQVYMEPDEWYYHYSSEPRTLIQCK